MRGSHIWDAVAVFRGQRPPGSGNLFFSPSPTLVSSPKIWINTNVTLRRRGQTKLSATTLSPVLESQKYGHTSPTCL